MSRMVWLGQVGYTTAEQRDSVFAAFAAKAGTHLEHLTPSTWDAFPDVPAGLTSGVLVDGLPGFWWCYTITPPSWESSESWAELATIALDPVETGGHQIQQIPE